MQSLHRFYLDLEVVGHKPTIEELQAKIKPSANCKTDDSRLASIQKQTDALLKNPEAALEAAHRKNSLDIFKSDIICAGFKFDSHKTRGVCYIKERDTVKELNKICKDLGTEQHLVEWVTWNGTEYDIPILTARALLYGYMDLYNSLPKSKNDKRNIDLMHHVTPTIWKAYYSLSDICKYLGIPVKEGLITGANVFDHYYDGNIKGIRKYCIQDVQALVKLAKRFNLDYTIKGRHHLD